MRHVVLAQFLVEDTAPEFDRPRALFETNEVLDFVASVRGCGKVEPVAVRLVTALGDDLDDVAVLQVSTKRHHLAVDPRADALVPDVGVNRVGEVDRRRPSRERLHLALRRESVDLFGVELDLEVLDELLRVAHVLLEFEQLPHPLEVALVRLVARSAFLVFPVGRHALLGRPVHFKGANLHLERHPFVADHRRVQRLVAVWPRHRDEVLDPAGHGRPRLVDDAQGGIAVLHAGGDDAEGDEVVDLVELDALLLELLRDAPQALDAAVDHNDGHRRFTELGFNRALQLLD